MLSSMMLKLPKRHTMSSMVGSLTEGKFDLIQLPKEIEITTTQEEGTEGTLEEEIEGTLEIKEVLEATKEGLEGTEITNQEGLL